MPGTQAAQLIVLEELFDEIFWRRPQLLPLTSVRVLLDAWFGRNQSQRFEIACDTWSRLMRDWSQSDDVFIGGGK